MSPLLTIILSTFIISLCVWVAVFFIFFEKSKLNKITFFLVSLSAGTLMGGAFLHLLPEASESLPSQKMFLIFLGAFIFFFFVEKLLHWRHCHEGGCKEHSFGYMNLVGDSIHNFIDGLIIASTVMANPALGIVSTIAIALHEIPQEVGDFGVLIHSGFSNKKALISNYLIALTVVLGGVVGYFALSHLQNIIPYLLPFAAGGFVYIAATDLIPEIRKEEGVKKSILSLLIFIIGIFIMFLVRD